MYFSVGCPRDLCLYVGSQSRQLLGSASFILQIAIFSLTLVDPSVQILVSNMLTLVKVKYCTKHSSVAPI